MIIPRLSYTVVGDLLQKKQRFAYMPTTALALVENKSVGEARQTGQATTIKQHIERQKPAKMGVECVLKRRGITTIA
ncbi:hypothetical protein LJ739_01135 [Aestuariibacter halophilus]|uniref:Uncharacterized protein n=1 Tax=Fluctibacter halophilus TaxID=226011 RepID=A0ABS8G403_9ALTE|nr:hypothetical protein [Aestuariibacter halophilus]MCC2614841.1 hypothetical protein [Aestuariibacter halophilus]